MCHRVGRDFVSAPGGVRDQRLLGRIVQVFRDDEKRGGDTSAFQDIQRALESRVKQRVPLAVESPSVRAIDVRRAIQVDVYNGTLPGFWQRATRSNG
jgi:hypothetical protein